MARTPWCRRQRVGRHSRRSGLPELFCGNAELLDLHVEGIVVHPQEPSRLAFVPSRRLQGRADRPSLDVHRSRLGELLERRAGWRWLFRASGRQRGVDGEDGEVLRLDHVRREQAGPPNDVAELSYVSRPRVTQQHLRRDRKSTRLNSSHGYISYAVFCLKKKKLRHYPPHSRQPCGLT